MNIEQLEKLILKQSHDNTHSVSRIYRATTYWLSKKELDENQKQKIINGLEEAAKQCQNQIDNIYLGFIEFKKSLNYT